jgi:hypothetical protein
MNRRRALILTVVVVVLGALVYLQFREWRHFDWEKFAEGSEGIRWGQVLLGVVFIYLADFLRAVRWKIFLRPTLPHAAWKGLISPQYVGFAGLALLGRPGELIRPYLIARKESTSFASQMAIWAVERVFDTAAVAILLLLDIFFVQSIRDLEYYDAFRKAGYVLGSFVVVVACVFIVLRIFGSHTAAWMCRQITPFSIKLANNVERKIRNFSDGLDTVHGPVSFLQISIISLAIWSLVALAYRQVTHAYPVDTGLPALDVPQVILLMGASIAGGVLQLPVVGGGSQLATIAVLNRVFDTGPELAVSCGILLWLVTFMSVTPLGLVLAHREHTSLRKLTQESQVEEEKEPVGGMPANPPPEQMH